MKKFLAAIVFGAVALSSVSANAILIEPFIGWQTGEVVYGGTTADISGIEFGGRLGATFTMFALGGEFSKADLTIDSSPELDLATTDMGLFFSVEFPILIRAYFTYFLSSEAEPDSGADYEGDGGYRLGVGFTALPFLSINVERILRKYDEQGSASIDNEVETTMLSVSIPLP